MATPSASTGAGAANEDQSARAARRKLEEALGKLDISQEEATPLAIDDRVDSGPAKWLLAGKSFIVIIFTSRQSSMLFGRCGVIQKDYTSDPWELTISWRS